MTPSLIIMSPKFTRSRAQALMQAKEGRAHILGEMTKALGSARTELSAHAPRIETVRITLSVSATGDSEVLVLTETGPNTGVFTGFVMTSAGASAR